jgi:lipid II:glycine glycyltransferase (peptidoglycan interpeptide bridge formation enzyme)
MIRKAIKNSVLVKKEDTKEAFNFIKKSHIINMQNIGGKRKPDQFFDYIRENFRSDKDYTLWLAYYNQKPIASLLLFYYNNTVEYYVPTILQDFRSIQPLSLIIFTAMMDASKKGYKYWNWGGTWPEQEGVYHFKRKWNADNIPYQHFIKIHNPKVHELSKEMIRKYFPYFYVIPYDKLNA